jgi:hypothetical protein
MLEEGVDFHYVDLDLVGSEGQLTGIGLTIKGYEGVLYHYQKARVVEEGEFARLQFGYTIIHPGEHDIDVLTNDENLHTIMGDILTSILTAQANEQIRTDYSKELNL